MPEIACQALEKGYDGRNLRFLAGLSTPTRRDILQIVDGSFRELGVQVPITRRDAALWMATRLGLDIIEGRIEPYGGALQISLYYSSEAKELSDWWDLVTNYEAACETDGIEAAKSLILEAAHNLISTLGKAAPIIQAVDK